MHPREKDIGKTPPVRVQEEKNIYVQQKPQKRRKKNENNTFHFIST